MKVAVSSKGKKLDSEVSYVFGRCPYYVIIELEDEEIKNFKPVKNVSAEQATGAGVIAAKTVAEQKVKAIITGNVGPRASSVLKQFNIQVYKGSGTVKEVVQLFAKNKLERIE